MLKRKTVRPKIRDVETMREYQEAQLFKRDFQRSRQCQLFRVAWGMPLDGFPDYQSIEAWEDRSQTRFDEFMKTEKFKSQQAALVGKRHLWADGKISKGELEIEERGFSMLEPQTKFDIDLERLLVKLNKPLYWREFVEDCILYRDVDDFTFITRPTPKPVLKWSNSLQRNELTIQNIFPDTTIKDFSHTEFVEELKKLQKKLPGSGIRMRAKRSFKAEQELQALDAETGLHDYEKADVIYKPSDDSAQEDQKRKNRVKQVRHRSKKRNDRLQ